MKKLIVLVFISMLPFVSGFAQFDKFSFQITAGITSPAKDLKGDSPFNYTGSWTGYWLNYNTTPPHLDSTMLTNVLLVDSGFVKNNYGAKTGFNISGAAKINFDKQNTIRGVLSLSYSNFNSFEGDKSGDMPFLMNNGYTYSPITYSSTFNVFGIGLGLEIAPTSFTNIFTPFFGGSFNFNFLSAELTRSFGRDSMKASFGSEFRIGASLNAGLELKTIRGVDLIAGVKYDFGNLLLKTTRSSISDYLDWGKTNMSLNDGEGYYYSSLTNPVGGGPGAKLTHTNDKQLDWWTFYFGVNIYPGILSPAPKK